MPRSSAAADFSVGREARTLDQTADRLGVNSSFQRDSGLGQQAWWRVSRRHVRRGSRRGGHRTASIASPSPAVFSDFDDVAISRMFPGQFVARQNADCFVVESAPLPGRRDDSRLHRCLSRSGQSSSRSRGSQLITTWSVAESQVGSGAARCEARSRVRSR